MIGHGRLEALKRMKKPEELIEVVDFRYLKPAEIKSLRIKDNKVVSDQWDLEKLNAEIEEIMNSYDGDIEQLENDLGINNLDELEIDYADLEGGDESLDDMEAEVRKAILIDFDIQDYDQARALVKELREAGEYIGGIFIDFLKNRNA